MRCVYTPIITTVNTSEHESSLSPAVHAQQPQYSNYTQNNAADDMGEKSDLYAYRPWNICITGTNVENYKYVVTYFLKCFRVSEVPSELETFELPKINWILRKYFSMFPRFSAVYFNYLINYFTYLLFFFCFCIRVLLYSPCHPGTHYAKQAVLRLRSACFYILNVGIKTRSSMPSSVIYIL